MALTLAFFVVGAAALYLGAEAALRGASGLSRALRISPFVLGALAFGVDVEGMGAAVVAAARGETAIAAGEAFGTVIFLFSLAFGVALLISRAPVPSPPPLMVALPAVPLIAAALAVTDRYVARLEGALLVLVYAGYVTMVLLRRRPGDPAETDQALAERGETPDAPGNPARPAAGGRPKTTERRPRRTADTVLLLAAGLVLLYGGATLLVAGGSRLVAVTALSSGFVGAAILGILVSLDEVLLEVLPIRRGEPELATGNLFGTLAAFTTLVLGLAALVRPLFLDSAAALALLAAALLYAMVGTAFLARGRAGRGLGVAVLLVYAAWLAYSSTI